MTAFQILNEIKDTSTYHPTTNTYTEEETLQAMEEFMIWHVQYVLNQIEDAKLSKMGEVIEELKQRYQ